MMVDIVRVTESGDICAMIDEAPDIQSAVRKILDYRARDANLWRGVIRGELDIIDRETGRFLSWIG